MKKTMKLFPVDYSFNWSYGVKLSTIRKDIRELGKLGCNHIEIEVEDDYGTSYVTYVGYNKRYETDLEIQERKLQEAKHLEEVMRRQEEYLENVKQKYQSYLDGQ